MAPPEDPPFAERRKFSRVQILEATSATVLAAAIIATAGGVSWLVVQLPTRLQQLESSIERILGNQDRFETRFDALDNRVKEHEVRIIKLELR